MGEGNPQEETPQVQSQEEDCANEVKTFHPPPKYEVSYSLELLDSITEKYMEGISLYKISALPNMPSYATILKWAKTNEVFRKNLQSAREIRALHFEESALEAVENAKDKDDVAVARLKLDAYKWASEVNDPETYGKKTQISGDALRPIQITFVSRIPDPEPLPEMPPIEAEKRHLSNVSDEPLLGENDESEDTT